jgi:ABC-type glycerol-3-phosphate transport system substrate-binding protein
VRRVLLIAIGSFMLVAAACGGSSKKTVASSSSSTPGSTGPGASTTVHFSGSGSSQFCDLARTLAQKTQVSPNTDLRSVYANFDSEASQILAAAPSAIKADVSTLIAGVRTLRNALAAVNYDETKLDASTLKSLSDPSFQASASRVSAYTQQVCGLNTGTSSSTSATSTP